MIFVGTTFSGMKHTFDSPPLSASLDRTNDIVLSGVNVYDIYVENSDILIGNATVPSEWNGKTVLSCSFSGSLSAGNVDFNIDNVRVYKRIKRDEFSVFPWVFVKDVPIETNYDFRFTVYDYICKPDEVYEYMVIPMQNQKQGNYVISNPVTSAIDGLQIIEDNDGLVNFMTEFDTKIKVQKNRSITKIETIGSKYPKLVSIGDIDYCSGNAEGCFLSVDCNGGISIRKSRWLREKLMNCLNNGRPKIIKHFDGKMYFISVSSNPTENNDEHIDKVITSFEWVEIGSCESEEDLINNGFLKDYR